MRTALVLALLVAAAAGIAGGAAGATKPPIAGTTLDGKRLSLADLRGKPVVINVWSSW